MLLSGVDIEVLRPVTAPDRLGNEVESGVPQTEAVRNVLVSPGATADMEAARPDGVTVAYTLHFPKGYEGSLEGCRVRLPAPWSGIYRVVGDPRPYMDHLTPGPWNRVVEVEAAHG